MLPRGLVIWDGLGAALDHLFTCNIPLLQNRGGRDKIPPVLLRLDVTEL